MMHFSVLRIKISLFTPTNTSRTGIGKFTIHHTVLAVQTVGKRNSE
jgi:hypothetical protein